MNPFDWRGPEFLVFYAAFAAAVLAVQRWGQDLVERAVDPRARLTDPYRIAYLRGGSVAALRVAVIGLIDRGLLRGAEGRLEAAPDATASHPVERSVLDHFEKLRALSSLWRRTALADGERAPLEAMGFLPDRRARARRGVVAFAAGAVLVAVAGLKIHLAMSRGRSNVEFLVTVTIVALWLVTRVTRRHTTRAGRRALAGLRELFGGLRERAASIEQRADSHDAAYLAAVFGAAALTASPAYAHVIDLFPSKVSAASASGGTSCGTASSCGTSCGSSCGGGGCGGGCGGCGS